MLKQVLSHGLFWINNGKQPQCPECNSKEYNATRSSLGEPCITKSRDIHGTLYVADLQCTSCLCKWHISRVDKGEK